MNTKLEKGQKVSKNFYLVSKIESMNHLVTWLDNHPSVFARHRPYPSAFIRSMRLHTVLEWLDKGWFWTIVKDNIENVRVISHDDWVKEKPISKKTKAEFDEAYLQRPYPDVKDYRMCDCYDVCKDLDCSVIKCKEENRRYQWKNIKKNI